MGTKAPETHLWYRYATGQKYHCEPVLQAHRRALCGAYSPEVNPPQAEPLVGECCSKCLRLLALRQIER